MEKTMHSDVVMGRLAQAAAEFQEMVDYLQSRCPSGPADWEYCDGKLSELQRDLKSCQRMVRQEKPIRSPFLLWSGVEE